MLLNSEEKDIKTIKEMLLLQPIYKILKGYTLKLQSDTAIIFSLIS